MQTETETETKVLSDLPSEAILEALTDLEAVEVDPRYADYLKSKGF